MNLRERVAAAVATGESCRSVAATFKVSVKRSQRFRATEARPMGGNRPLQRFGSSFGTMRM
jgi:transposase